ncbi:protein DETOXIFICATION 16-like [Silene latifolia]|uniref:protein DETOXIFICATION 16-like n=1 Tax=Silene latifolia TaxID=37657 RepID=UPI003D77DF9F
MDKHENLNLTMSLIQEQNPSNMHVTNGEHYFVEEMKKQACLAAPLIMVGFLTFSLHIISLMFVGHLGELPLSAASLATSFAYVSGFSFLLGMASTLETLCGQSFGAKQYHMVGIHTHRAILVLTLISIPIAIIWFYTEQILAALGQDPRIAEEAGSYAQFMIPSLVPYGVIQCFIRFFQTQNIIYPMVVTSGVTTLLHVVMCWTFVFEFGLGSRGAALANTVSYWVNALLLVIFVRYSSLCSSTWTGFSKASFQGFPGFLRLAVPSALMVCLDMWSFEMIVLLSGLLPNSTLETSVLSISLNTTSFVWVIPEGFSAAVSTRISNELGAGNPQIARLAVWVVLCMTLSESMLVSLILLLIRNIWGYAYSSDTEVITYLADIMPLLALTNFLDGLTCVLSGTARGCGWQKMGAYINLASFYLMGLPVAIVLAFVLQIGGKGLWLGVICSLIIQVLSFICIVVKTNWEREAENAMERVFEASVPRDWVS